MLTLDAMVIFTTYFECDLKTSGKIQSNDQVITILGKFRMMFSYNEVLHLVIDILMHHIGEIFQGKRGRIVKLLPRVKRHIHTK